MRTDIRLKLDSAERVQAFCREHPDENPVTVATVGTLTTLLSRADALLEQQRAAVLAVEASVANKDRIRSIIRGKLEHLQRIADAASLRQPDVAIRLRLPKRSAGQRRFLTAARVVLAGASTRKELLHDYGLPETLLEDTERAITEYEAAMEEKAVSIGSQVGASAQIDAITREIMEAVRHLDALCRLRFQGDPELLAAWKSARNTHWRIRLPAGPDASAQSIEPAA